MRKSVLLLGLFCLLPGCSNGPKGASANVDMSGPPPRRFVAPTKMTVQEVGQSAFGTLYQSAKVDGETAEFVYSAPDDKTPAQIYRRAVILTATAIPTALRNEPKVKRLRFTTTDPKNPARKLVVFSLGREDGGKVAGHGSFDGLLGVVKVEYADPEYKAVTAQPHTG